jgi:phosphoglycolate phosphatase-like HAD superfamily hydrolase
MSLPSWREGPARDAIVHYLARIGAEDGPDYVPPAERVAVFDNDGTLWCEKPAYVQAFFILARLREQAAADPALAESEVVKALLANDLAKAMEHGPAEALGVLLRTHAGITTEEFEAAVLRWMDGFRHPRFDVPFTGLVYAPMLELLALLREHGFRAFVVTGGGVDFVRAVGAQLYGVEPDDVVGSAVEVEVARRDGRIVLVRSGALDGSPNEGAPKVAAIHAHIGRRPIVAVGNTAGDREMLEFAHTGTRPSLSLVLDHDDDEREYAYEGAAMTDPAAEPLVATGRRLGWTIVSMRRDWDRVFP